MSKEYQTKLQERLTRTRAFEQWYFTGPALVVVPVVPWNHSIFEKGAMEPLDF